MGIKASSQVTITDITDAYSVSLTSEAYSFMGDTTGAPTGLSCTTQAVAYRGTQLCTSVTIGSVSCPTGISATISENNSSSPMIIFTTTATIKEACEAIIPVEVDGITINKKFSFSVAKEGPQGTDAYSVDLTRESYTFDGDITGAPTGLSCTTQAVAYRGTQLCTKVTVGTITCPTGISATISDNNTTTPTITFTTTDIISSSCEATIPITVDDVTINKMFSFSVAKTGEAGPSGMNLYTGTAEFIGDWQDIGYWTETDELDSLGNKVMSSQKFRAGLYKLVSAKSGDVFTLSMNVRTDAGIMDGAFYAHEYDLTTGTLLSGGGAIKVLRAIGTTETRVYKTYTVINDCNLAFALRVASNITTDTLYVSSIKLERGNVATDWVQSINDVTDNSVIGGRNLIRNSKNMLFDDYYFGVRYLRGKATSDANGVLTFPELDFTPSKIVVWNIQEVNEREVAAENGWDFDQIGWLTEYTYKGELYVAVYQYNLWVTQTTDYVAGLSYVRADSDIVTVNGNVYSFNVNVVETQYNYAIYA